MKKYLFFLLAVVISMPVWSQILTHTLTIESPGVRAVSIQVTSADGGRYTGSSVKNDTVHIESFRLNEGELYTIRINPNGNTYETSENLIYNSFKAWMRDGAVFSTSPELGFVMGTSDIYLTAVMTRVVEPPYAPGANFFDASTGTLTLDEIRDGNLTQAYKIAQNRYKFGGNDVTQIIVAGSLKSQVCLDDFNNALSEVTDGQRLNSLRLLDLSQTSGMKTLTSNYYNATDDRLPGLKHVILGADLDSIARYAFFRTYIDTIDCYAVIPPRCQYDPIGGGAFQSMRVPIDEIVVRVPPESVESYKQARGWKYFQNIQPLYETGTVSVTLPTDVPDGYYEDMTVELVNLRSQLIQNRPVLNFRRIVFGGQVSGCEYQASLKNAYGQVVGQTETGVLGEETALPLIFGKLLQTKDVSVTVTLPDKKDVTDKVAVLWTDEEEKAMGHASQLKAVAEGTKLICAVKLRDELARQYVAPDAMPLTVDAEGNNLLTLQLQPVLQMTLHGLVKDKATGEAVADATVSLTQQQGDGYTEAVTATTDENGRYTLQGTNEHGELSVTAPGYLPLTVTATPAADGALPDAEIELFNGVIVNTGFTYTEAVAEGEEAQVIDGYDAYTDAAYQVYNKTKGSPITDFINKQGRLYFTTGVETGDELIITVTGHSNGFSPVSDTCEISGRGIGYVIFPIVEKGGFKVRATYPDSIKVMGVLYDSDGRFVRSNTYRSDSLLFAGLDAGDYTLVSMTANTLLRRASRISILDDMQLVEGTDYAKTAVHITDGRILSVDVPNVPELDKEKLHFTDNTWTYFTADQNVLHLGQTNTVSSQVFFANQYAGRISNVELVVDIPEEIALVENSAILNRQSTAYRIENGQYIFPDIENNVLRFCLKPNAAGEFRVTGSVRFKLDGIETIQPIGTVWVKAKGFAISSYGFIGTYSVLYINGTAPWYCRDKKVEIYDYDQLVATTSVDSDGSWSVNIQLASASTNYQHAIKARMVISHADVMETETRYVYTRKGANKIANRVVMLDQRKKSINFDFYDPSAEKQHYTYILKEHLNKTFPYTTEFSFFAYFDEEDMPDIKDVQIVVLASDGTTRILEAEYDATRQCWYAISDYPSPSKLPISAYAYSQGTYTPMSYEEKTAIKEALAESIEKLLIAGVKAAKQAETEVLPGDDETLNLKCTFNGKEPFALSTKEMDYDEAVAYALRNRPFIFQNDSTHIVYTLVDGIDEAVMIIVDADQHIALRTVITNAEVEDAGAMPKRKNTGHKKNIDPASIITKTSTIGSDALTIMGLKDYFMAPGEEYQMVKEIRYMNDEVQQQIERVNKLLMTTCPNSDEPRFKPETSKQYIRRETELIKLSNYYLGKMNEYKEAFMNDLGRKTVWDIGTAFLGGGLGKAAAIGAAGKIDPKAVKVITKVDDFVGTPNGEAASEALGFLGDAFQYISDLPSLDELFSFDFRRNYEEFIYNENALQKEVIGGLNDLWEEMVHNQDNCGNDEEECPEGENCEEECEGEDCQQECEGDDCGDGPGDDPDPDDDDPPHGPRPNRPGDPFPKPARPLIDPSGFVYEAVQSNRVEGATATIYYKDFVLGNSGNSTGEKDLLWDAENYGQINPQITGSDGMYQWDVPQGLWQVRVQKEGYANTQTDWLPVPPPQLDINIPIVRMRLPKVERAHAYEDAVAVKFDSYMTPATLNTELITVTENNAAAEGTIELTDEEAGDGGATYASKLRFVPAKPFTANEVTLRISGEVQSYSGIAMDEPFEVTLPIEREVKSLKAAKTFNVRHEGSGILHVKGEPASAAAGKTVAVHCASGLIASTTETFVVLDQNGQAEVTVHGGFPGTDYITFTMDDPDLSATTTVKVFKSSNTFTVSAPEASVPSGTEVEQGTQVTLSCTTEGAAIYYTLDGSSPLDSDTRILYDGTPVVINAETTLMAVAVVEGKGTSEVVTYHYTVAIGQAITEVNSHDRKVIPVHVHDAFEVSGMDGNFSVSVYSMSGALQMRQEMVKSGQKVNAATLPTGIYLVVVNGKADFTQRIIKQ